MSNTRLNGSANLLARAIQGIFEETNAALKKDLESFKKDMQSSERRMGKIIEDEGKTTRTNVQSQIAQLRKEVKQDISQIRQVR